MDILAVIPARSNSTRLPGKNTRLIAGRPSLAWAIDHLRACSAPLRIVVATDDAAAMRIAVAEGVEVLTEPPTLAHHDNLFCVVTYCLDQLGEFDRVILGYANGPIRPPGIFDRLIAKMDETGCDIVNTLARVQPRNHPLYYFRVTKSSEAIQLALHPLGNSQDFTPVYGSTSVGSLLTADAVRQMATDRPRAMLALDARAVTIEPDEWVEIDTELDAQWAEFLLCRNRVTSSAVATAYSI